MKKKKKTEVGQDTNDEHNLEIIKAVAQAWYGHSGSSRPTNEFDAYRRNFKGKPSRFKLEGIQNSRLLDKNGEIRSDQDWDFRQSLWDSYEIVSVAKKLETGLSLDNPFTGQQSFTGRVSKKHKESSNSLRNLFNRISSRRFTEADISLEK